MKKVLTFLAAVALLASAAIAQPKMLMGPAKANSMEKQVMQTSAQQAAPAKLMSAKPMAFKAAGDTISSFPWTEGFNATTLPTGFTAIDADNDGHNWDCTYWNINGGTVNSNYAHSGDGMIASASYINNIGVLTPDNWLILPAFELPTDATDFNFTWYEADLSYAESYTVYITTAGNTTANFTAGADTNYTTNAQSAVFVKRTIDLSSYAGQTVFIAFRHYNVSDNYWLFIDDMRIGGPETPELSLDGPTTVLLGNPATYTMTTNATQTSWIVDGNTDTTTGTTLVYTFTTDGPHTVVATATNSVGTSYDTLEVNVVDCSIAISDFPYTEDFEGEIPCWTMVLGDAANTNAWGLYPDANGLDGSNQDFRFNSYSRVTSGNYNQWLISPELSLDENTDYLLVFWYKAQNSSDKFQVLASTTTSDTAAFTMLQDFTTPTTAWTAVPITLPDTVKYIAFKYYGNYAYYLYLDNVTVKELGAPDVTVSGPALAGTGMPATYTVNTMMADSVVWYVDGDFYTDTTDIITISFATAGIHTIVVEAINTYGSNFDTLEVDVFSCDDITIPYTPDFSVTLGCWANESRTNPSGWFLGADEPAIDGEIFSISATSSLFGMTDIDHDNWLFSPEITMPATGDYEVAWAVKPFTTNYPGDHYGVYVISGTDTTLLFEETLNANMEDYAQRAALLNVTGQFRVAFRHFNSAGGYVIVIDSIQMKELEAPSVELVGPATTEMNLSTSFTAISPLADSFAWTVDGNAQTETGNVLSYTFTTGGNHTIAVTATNNAGSAADSMVVNVYACPTITTFPWTEGFEDASTLECFRFIDNDGDGYGWALGNSDGYGNNGSNGAIWSASYINNVGELEPDNWMITPALELPTGTVELSWYDKAQDPNYNEDSYTVYITTGAGEINDFSTVLYSTEACPEEWTMHIVNLTNYAGQTVRIAFRHHNSYDMYHVLIDDLRVGDAQPPVIRLEGPADAEKGVPCVFTASSTNTDNYYWTVDGNAVSGNANTLTYTFTSVGNHTVAVYGTNSVGTSQPVSHMVNVYSCDDPLIPLPWNESFEGNTDCWIFTADDERGFEVNGDYPSLAADGNNFLLGWTPSDADANQWAISMPFTMPAHVNNATLSWVIASNHQTSSLTISYEILVSTQGVNPDYFTTRLFNETVSTGNANEEREISLASLAGKTFRIAIHNTTAAGNAYMIMDKLRIASRTGIDNASNINVAIYPNPASDKLNIEGEGIQMVEMFDVNGRSVLTSMHDGQIDISSLANGVYVVRVTAIDGIRTEKIVKK